MAAILQHVPHMDDLTQPATATFDTVAQLLAIPWVLFGCAEISTLKRVALAARGAFILDDRKAAAFDTRRKIELESFG
jgi:hypothetical protein